jgi:hypothetical protein
MRWWGKSAYVVGAVFSVLIACGDGEVHDHDNLREDVLYCEEAVSALKACCRNVGLSSISCEYSYDYFPAATGALRAARGRRCGLQDGARFADDDGELRPRDRCAGRGTV